jgi:hypothetical protein
MEKFCNPEDFILCFFGTYVAKKQGVKQFLTMAGIITGILSLDIVHCQRNKIYNVLDSDSCSDFK